MAAAPGPEGIRKAVRDRILNDMLGSIQDPTGGGWRVLILDAFTTKLLGAAMRMSDVLDQNVSVVEDINRVRQPMQQAAVYFIQPSPDSITCLLNDFSKGKGLYPSVHIFFTGKVTTEGLNRIKSCERLIAVVRTLKESNIELIVVDSRTFVTDHDDALIKLMGERAETSKSETDRELGAIATRLATAFTTLNEFPSIRYQVGKPPDINDPPGQATRALLCQKLGNELLRRLGDLQREGKLPPKETCDVLVLDRSYDALAPVMHEWTYESMVYDLLYDKLDGNIFKYQSENQAGKVEERVVTIGEHDSIWVELRHAFVADLYKTLATRMSEFQAKDKAARAAAKDGLSGAQIKALIQSQPQNRDILSRLATHVELSAQLRAEVKERDLMQLGELEQDLVFGEKNSKDLISYLQQLATDLDESAEVRMEEDKMRLLMAYLATHPGKMDATKKAQWMKLAKISPQAMDAVCNLAFLGVNIMAAPPEGAKSSKSFFGSGSKAAKAPKSVRKKKQEDATVWACFDPLLMDILTDMVGGRLSQDEFPYVRPPQDAQDGPDKSAASSARSARSGLNWARGARGNAGGAASGPMRRLIVFIIGGCTRSESRIAHVLSKQLGRDVILGSTNMLSPAKFINVLPLLGTLEE